MSVLAWLAAALLFLFVAVSLLLLVAHLRSPGRRVGGETGWLLFDVVFGVVAVAMVLAEVEDAFYIIVSVFVLRRVGETLWRSRAVVPAE